MRYSLGSSPWAFQIIMYSVPKTIMYTGLAITEHYLSFPRPHHQIVSGLDTFRFSVSRDDNNAACSKGRLDSFQTRIDMLYLEILEHFPTFHNLSLFFASYPHSRAWDLIAPCVKFSTFVLAPLHRSGPSVFPTTAPPARVRARYD